MGEEKVFPSRGQEAVEAVEWAATWRRKKLRGEKPWYVFEKGVRLETDTEIQKLLKTVSLDDPRKWNRPKGSGDRGRNLFRHEQAEVV